MRYAENTSVPVEKSKAEIEATVTRYGATGFTSGWMDQRAFVAFEMKDRRVRFVLTLPARNHETFRYTNGGERERSEAQALKAWEQACRQLWRALALAIKAKLEVVASGISTYEHEFLAHIVLPSGLTIGETIVPKLEHVYTTGKLPPLLPGPGEDVFDGQVN